MGVRKTGLGVSAEDGTQPARLGGTDRLSDRTCRTATRPGKYSDGKGLYLAVMPTGTKLWRLKYRVAGREKVYSIGPYPEVSLAQARIERDKARAWLREDKDPVAERRSNRSRAHEPGNSFSDVAEDFFAVMQRRWSRDHAVAVKHRYTQDLEPVLGTLPVADIDTPRVLEALRAIEKRGAHETASKCRVTTAQIFAHAIAIGKASSNPALGLAKAMPRPAVRNRATIPLEEMPALFEALARVPAEINTKLALYWLILTATRTVETRFAPWGEVDRDRKHWRIQAERMKMRDAHVVPLSRQAQRILELAVPLRRSDDDGALIFPGFTKAGSLCENALLAILARAGYYGRQTTHGFRASFSTWANNGDHARPDVIEACLAHKVPGVRGDYNRASYLRERLDLLQKWADQCESWGMRLLP